VHVEVDALERLDLDLAGVVDLLDLRLMDDALAVAVVVHGLKPHS
jgi:hypothetical protein